MAACCFASAGAGYVARRYSMISSESVSTLSPSCSTGTLVWPDTATTSARSSGSAATFTAVNVSLSSVIVWRTVWQDGHHST